MPRQYRSWSPRNRGCDSLEDSNKSRSSHRKQYEHYESRHRTTKDDLPTRRRKHIGSRSRSKSRTIGPKRKRSSSRSRGISADAHRDYRRFPGEWKRSRSRSMDSRRRSHEKKRSRSNSSSGFSSSSQSHWRERKDRSPGSLPNSDERRRWKKKKKKESRRDRSRERKKDKKKGKKEKKGEKQGSSSSHWGKHGIITEADIFAKSAEFHMWLVEERKINPETTSKDQSRKEFAKFVEDFNTATLPHEKYYHMEAYERRMSSLRSGEFVPPADDTYDPQADLKAISSAHKRMANDQESYLSREQLMELRKVQHERHEAGKMKLLGMDIKQNMGVRMDGSSFE